MADTIYSAQPELQHPARFFAAAAADLRHSLGVGWQLFRRNLRARYRRSWLGYLWLLLPTVGTTLVWVYIQSRRIISVTPTEIPYPVYVLTGTILWQLFVDALNAPLQQLNAGRQLITRSRVPPEALVLAGVLETLLNCLIRVVVLIPVLMVFGIGLGPRALFVPAGIAALTILGVAIGLLVAPAGLLYDDIGRVITLATGFWFFLTPVIYATPVTGFLRFNPVTPLLDETRSWLTTSGGSAGGFAAVTAAAVVMLLVAWLLQRLARPHVVARLG